MSRDELQVLKKYLESNLSKEFILASLSLTAVLIRFVKEPRGSLKFCVIYCSLNALTIKNKYLLPLIRKTINWICNAVYFTKLDIIAAFNKICMAAGEEWKATFRTRLDFYAYLVILFGLANEFNSFQNFINDVLRNNILDFFVTV